MTSIMEHNYVIIDSEGKAVRSKAAVKHQVMSKFSV